MAKIKAKPGDRIIVTNSRLTTIFGCEFTIIESRWCPGALGDISECIWVQDDTQRPTFWLRHDSYETVGQSQNDSSVSCSDCMGTGKIVLFTSTIKCERCNG